LLTKADNIIIFNVVVIYRLCNVPFSNGDKTWIKNLYQFKNAIFNKRLAEFLKINCNRERLGMLLTEI